MHDGNPLNLDRFLDDLNDWGMTLTEDIDPAVAAKYVFRQFSWRLPKCFNRGTAWQPRRGRSRPSRRPRIVSASRSGWMPPRLPPRGAEPSSFSMMAWTSASGIGGIFEDNTYCSAGTWRTGTRVMSSPGCSISSRTPVNQVTKEEAKRANEQSHRQNDAQQGAPQEVGELDKSQSGLGLQQAVLAEHPSHHCLRGSREGRDLAPERV